MADKTIYDLIDDINTAERRIAEALPIITIEYAESTNNLVIQRIQKEGIEGKSYSTEPLYASPSMFNRKGSFKPRGKYYEQTKRGKEKLNDDGELRKTMYLGSGYKELREVNGLQTTVVDATFSGRTMQNIRTLSTESINEFHVQVIIGAADADSKKKLSGLYGQYGDFLEPKAEEIDITKEAPVTKILNIIEDTLNIKL